MPSDGARIQHISDTATWVAHCRALESQRPDALFHDPLAGVLTGSRGLQIDRSMRRTLRYGEWSVVIRTVVIDHLIQRMVAGGVDMVINLGAGLDTRPWRLPLPASVRWVEVDYPGISEHKRGLLETEKPGVTLEALALDLSITDERRELFRTLNAKTMNALILTEGVIPYLTEDQVAALAGDLHAAANFHFWIAECYSTLLYPYLQAKRRRKLMKNAPLRFFPEDWLGLFHAHGWTPQEIKYPPEEGIHLGRPMPAPWWARLLARFSGRKKTAASRRAIGYALFSRR